MNIKEALQILEEEHIGFIVTLNSELGWIAKEGKGKSLGIGETIEEAVINLAAEIL